MRKQLTCRNVEKPKSRRAEEPKNRRAEEQDMREEIILLETKMAYPDKQVFKLQFAIGEFDMVVVDPASITTEIYEIKHSAEVVPAQYRFLIDPEKCNAAEFRYGKIKKRAVIYRGESKLMDNGIEYINVEEYLKAL